MSAESAQRTATEQDGTEREDEAPAPRRSGGGVLGVPTDPQQLDLLADPRGKLPGNVFQLVRAADAAAQGDGKRGPGRPKGSRNKRTAKLEALIPHKYGDPVEFQASIYAMPLDQLCQLLLAADGTIERREQLDEMLVQMAQEIRLLTKTNREQGDKDAINRLAEACEALEKVAQTSAGKPGDVAIKALNLQMAGARIVSEYVHSKKAVEANVNFNNLPTIVMPGGGMGVPDFAQQDQAVRYAGDMLAKALLNGSVQPQEIVGLEFRDGQFLLPGGETLDEGDGEAGSDGE